MLFFSSLIIRDLTLRSATSFGSFHLLRLLYDEYMFYLVEHRVAQVSGVVPIAVIGKVSIMEFTFSVCLRKYVLIYLFYNPRNKRKNPFSAHLLTTTMTL